MKEGSFATVSGRFVSGLYDVPRSGWPRAFLKKDELVFVAETFEADEFLYCVVKVVTRHGVGYMYKLELE